MANKGYKVKKTCQQLSGIIFTSNPKLSHEARHALLCHSSCSFHTRRYNIPQSHHEQPLDHFLVLGFPTDHGMAHDFVPIPFCVHKLIHVLSIDLYLSESEINTLVEHFKSILVSSGVNINEIPDQWTIVMSNIYQQPKFTTEILLKLSWPEVNRMHRDQCSSLLNLIDLILYLTASTAECERGFDVMKMVKSDWRSNLKCDSLSDLLMVHLVSPDIQKFDPNPALELWHASSIRSRRPAFLDSSECHDRLEVTWK
ncbi:UNVERIFIED_CONTAM: hypothetical protein FKN15_070316 [Acipenser sinensis]